MLRPSPAQPTVDVGAPEDLCREWYETHGTAVYGYLRFHLSSADEAEDVTADVFLRAVAAADRFDPARGPARAWLLRIARNALHDQRRRERHRRHVSLTALYDLQSDAPSPEERLLREEAVTRLLAAVAQLGEADRELIGLRYGSGLDTAATAATLGLREAVVRTRLWRALARLRRVLASAP
ncbi:MAG: RNA polymerase sigma factor [Gemmatimonadales bacterium]